MLDMGLQISSPLPSCCLAMDAAIKHAQSHRDLDGGSVTGKRQTCLILRLVQNLDLIFQGETHHQLVFIDTE